MLGDNEDNINIMNEIRLTPCFKLRRINSCEDILNKLEKIKDTTELNNPISLTL